MSLKDKLAKYSVLETKRLRLRPVGMVDLEDMYEYASDQETTRWTFPVNQTLEDTRRGIEEIYLSDPVGKYALELKSKQKMIGTLDTYGLSEQDKSLSIGFILNKAYWGQGLASEALQAVLDLLLLDLDFEVVKAGHAQENQASKRLLEKMGFQLVTQKEADKVIAGQRVTSYYYELYRKEWQKFYGH
ncbi:GNAT family N-acetyltransferase [Streptococcus suis]|uniref:GNAT family N-acetyltransferase n=1 Tax=Streptococcus suis TaxID=1307 RepID=UPI001ABDC564|nr:GNAT family N-acetyltransferase [Streptococcus suis]